MLSWDGPIIIIIISSSSSSVILITTIVTIVIIGMFYYYYCDYCYYYHSHYINKCRIKYTYVCISRLQDACKRENAVFPRWARKCRKRVQYIRLSEFE